jgi:hypothetical protein
MNVFRNCPPGLWWKSHSTETRPVLTFAIVALAASLIGWWSSGPEAVKADSGASPLIQIQSVRGDTSLSVYYPDLNKLFVYQSPFVGLPTWGCAYSIQLSTPGGTIERQPCPTSGQKF